VRIHLSKVLWRDRDVMAGGGAGGDGGGVLVTVVRMVEGWLGETGQNALHDLARLLHERPSDVITAFIAIAIPLLGLSVLCTYLLLRELDKADPKKATRPGAAAAPEACGTRAWTRLTLWFGWWPARTIGGGTGAPQRKSTENAAAAARRRIAERNPKAD